VETKTVNLLPKSRLLFAIAGALTVAIAVYLYWDEHRAASSGPPSQARHMGHLPPIERRPGIRQPKASPADQVRLADQTEVLGVTAAGKCRAYELGTFASSNTRLINDLIGDVPVTVAYCMKPKRQRAFTSDQRGLPLEVWVVSDGREDRVVCKIGEIAYTMNLGNPSLPLKELPVTRTTWKNWKQDHPDTDVCLRPLPAWRTGRE
jgi:hypothetical protein